MTTPTSRKPNARHLGLPRSVRVRQSSEFTRAMRHGRRATDPRLTMWAYPNGRVRSRLGLAVGKRHGGAVRRNRIKRLLREAFRLRQHELPGGLDLICVPRQQHQWQLENLGTSMVNLARRLARELEQN